MWNIENNKCYFASMIWHIDEFIITFAMQRNQIKLQQYLLLYLDDIVLPHTMLFKSKKFLMLYENLAFLGLSIQHELWFVCNIDAPRILPRKIGGRTLPI